MYTLSSVHTPVHTHTLTHMSLTHANTHTCSGQQRGRSVHLRRGDVTHDPQQQQRLHLIKTQEKLQTAGGVFQSVSACFNTMSFVSHQGPMNVSKVWHNSASPCFSSSRLHSDVQHRRWSLSDKSLLPKG